MKGEPPGLDGKEKIMNASQERPLANVVFKFQMIGRFVQSKSVRASFIKDGRRCVNIRRKKSI